jgi:hypothetical protein
VAIAIRVHAAEFAFDLSKITSRKHASVPGPAGRFDVSRANDVFDSVDLGFQSPSDLADG